MKKVFKITLLVTALALAMTVSAAASYTDFAAAKAAGGTVINPTNAVSYEVTATNSTASEAQCVVLVLKGLWEDKDFTNSAVPLTADSILYIDQKPVPGNNGTAAFNVYPKSLPDSTVILTGLTQNPQVVGYTEGKGVTVSGKVEFFSGSVKRVADVTLTDGGTNVFTRKTDVAGLFSFDTVPDGTYTLVATAESHVSYTKKNIVVNGAGIANLTGTLLGGGLNANADINAADLSVLLTDYNKTRTNAMVPAADINGNNDINAADLSILLTNYNKTAITE